MVDQVGQHCHYWTEFIVGGGYVDKGSMFVLIGLGHFYPNLQQLGGGMAVNILDGKVAGRVKLSIRNCKFSFLGEAIEPYTACHPHHNLVNVHLSRQKNLPRAM